MDIVQEAKQFEENTSGFKSKNERIIASKRAKELILAINERYKKTKDGALMDLMKRLTAIKRKAEKRLNTRPRI
ncbi:hypothetical protein [Luteirhabdus pelagi]|jgi:hypothetical protein|uniref:hypothetical protein n=1 Tax=Luteirhabdus pelagi TaxID=2792783 RepID=UPI0019394D82|nr:hypothetical protein [Luteirhabdus pelagi]MCT8338900.1 hypothetical protein [Thermobacterium salinum]